MDKVKVVLKLVSAAVILACAIYLVYYRWTNPDLTEMRAVLNNLPVVLTVIVASGVLIWSRDA